jgi:hypothetical protein
MSTSLLRRAALRKTSLRQSGLAAAAASALIAVGVPLALAVPTSAPPSDGEGYVNSTARCTAPDTAVIFGATESSRVAICKTASGSYQYRGVRVSDGARLITTASQTSTNSFVANNDGVKYTVTPTALSVTANGDTFRTETWTWTWTDYHGPQAPTSSTSTATTPSTSGSTTPTTSGTASTSASATSSAPKTSAAPSTTTVPLPPPMPAEVGGDSSSTIE